MRKRYRHEQKYYINYGEYIVLSDRLRKTLDTDPNADENGEYFIRSLYFDDYQDSAFREKIDGVDARCKYRIRTYNLSEKDMHLEIKEKAGQYISKRALPLEREQAEALIAGNPGFLATLRDPVAWECFVAFRTRALKPRVIVDYTREAYCYPLEDVRVTFDKDLHTGNASKDLFNPNVPTYAALEDYGMIMEVKFNRYLPMHVRSLIQTGRPVRSAVSKYCICRKFE